MPFRLDTHGSVRKVTKTPQGGVRVDAALTRTGVLEYPGPNGTVIREYRPADEVARADSLATLAHAPVTNRHPPGAVTPRNYKQYSVGTVAGEARMDGDLVVASLVIQDADALSAVETGARREVSCGYTCDVDETPGTTPEGIRFDRVQRNIVYNHVAIVERGRAGSSVALRMDAAGNLTIDEEDSMDPKEIAKLQADLKAATERADKAEAARDAATARADAAQARADAAEQREKARTDAADLEQAIAVATKVLGKDFKADGLTLAQVRAKVAEKDSGLRLDGKSEAYVGALFDAAAARADKAEQTAPAVALRAGLRQIPGGRQDAAPPTTPGRKPFRSAAQARADMLERQENEWRDKDSQGE